MKTSYLIPSMSFALAMPLMANPLVADLDTKHDPVVLEMKFPVGQTRTQTSKIEQNMQMDMGEQKMDQGTKITSVTETKIAQKEGSENLMLTSTTKRIAMEMNMMGQKMGFDSDNKESLEGNPMAAGAGVVGKSVQVELTPKYEFVQVTGSDEIAKELGPAAAGFMDEASIKQNLGLEVGASLPKTPVKAGDEIPVNTTVNTGGVGNMTLKGTYKILGLGTLNGTKVVVIDMVATMDMVMEEQEGVKMSMTDGKMTGTMYWDLTNGCALRTDMDQSMTMVMNETMKMPVKSKISVSTEIK